MSPSLVTSHGSIDDYRCARQHHHRLLAQGKGCRQATGPSRADRVDARSRRVDQRGDRVRRDDPSAHENRELRRVNGQPGPLAGFFFAQMDLDHLVPRVRANGPRLLLRVVHQRHRVQPDRCAGYYPMGEVLDDAPIRGFAGDSGVGVVRAGDILGLSPDRAKAFDVCARQSPRPMRRDES